LSDTTTLPEVTDDLNKEGLTNAVASAATGTAVPAATGEPVEVLILEEVSPEEAEKLETLAAHGTTGTTENANT
jgi:hypothetical protein